MLLGLEKEVNTDVEDVDHRGFIEKRTDFVVPKFGNAALCVGKTFTVLPGYAQHELFTVTEDHRIKNGIIGSVFIKANNQDPKKLWFGIYDADKNRRPPKRESDEWKFAKCEDFMTTNSKRRMIKWNNSNFIGEALVGRRVCKLWGNGKYYRGTIVAFRGNKKYLIRFDDGDEASYHENSVIDMLRLK